MVRKTLALLATGLLLFAALLIQMTVVQAASPSQTEPDPAIEEPLPQPLRIRINQLIPFTFSLPAALLGDGSAVTSPLTTTGTLTTVSALDDQTQASELMTDTEQLTATGTVTAAAALTATDADVTTTAAALSGALDDALSDAIADAGASLTETAALTDSAAITAADVLTSNVLTSVAVLTAVPVTLELTLDLVVTNTLTSTVPASVTLQLADRTTRTLPISISVAALPDGEIYVELLPAPETAEDVAATPTLTATDEATASVPATATLAVTPTVEVTPTLEVTPTVAVPSGLPVIETTATTTANLRAGPSTTTFDIVGQVAPGQTLSVVGISEDGQWYLLDGGAWIAVFLAADAAIPNLPLATQELIDQASGVTAVEPVTPTPILAATITATVEATPVPAATTVVSPTTTTDANLRAGPGTEFPVIGGTVTGQTINIVGRNADATWWRLDNTGWLFGDLVLNPPAAETVPVVNADGTLVEPATVPAATSTPTSGGLALPTPTPAAGASTGATTAATTATADENDANYISAVESIVTTYDGIVQTLDSLIAEARTNSAVLTDPAWANRISATLILLRRTGASVGELVAPTALAVAQDSLIDAATQYTAAGNALSQAAATGAVAQLDAAETAIQAANASLGAVETALAAAQ